MLIYVWFFLHFFSSYLLLGMAIDVIWYNSSCIFACYLLLLLVYLLIYIYNMTYTMYNYTLHILRVFLFRIEEVLLPHNAPLFVYYACVLWLKWPKFGRSATKVNRPCHWQNFGSQQRSQKSCKYENKLLKVKTIIFSRRWRGSKKGCNLFFNTFRSVILFLRTCYLLALTC